MTQFAPENGWCASRTDKHNGAYDHRRQKLCVGFVSEEERMAQAEAQIQNHSVHYPNGATSVETAYVLDTRGV